MGKGDIKTKKGKRNIGSYGKHRPHKARNAAATKQNENSTAKQEVKE